jgi:leader peptidase (prepilin peptidase)/N-methyltransferase
VDWFLGTVGPFGPWPAHLILVAAGIPLAVIDQVEHRLPDRITLPVWAVSSAYLTLLAHTTQGWGHYAQAHIAMAVAFLAFWLIAEWPGQPLGFGDVKLAGLIALHLGWHGPSLATAGLSLGIVLAGLGALGRWWRVKGGLLDPMALGPWLIAGYYLGLWLVAGT